MIAARTDVSFPGGGGEMDWPIRMWWHWWAPTCRYPASTPLRHIVPDVANHFSDRSTVSPAGPFSFSVSFLFPPVIGRFVD